MKNIDNSILLPSLDIIDNQITIKYKEESVYYIKNVRINHFLRCIHCTNTLFNSFKFSISHNVLMAVYCTQCKLIKHVYIPTIKDHFLPPHTLFIFESKVLEFT